MTQRSLVYVWLYPDGRPFYVGVGNDRRVKWPKRNPLCDSIRAKIESQGQEVLIEVTEYADRDSCYQAERRLISLYGRRDLGTGVLSNMTDGGEQGGSVNPVTSAKISAARKGTKASEETRAKLREARARRGPASAETRAKMSAALRGRKQPPEEIEKRLRIRWQNSWARASASGEDPPSQDAPDLAPVPSAGTTLSKEH